ncbi:MAG: PHP domain-containing protein, partial [Alistipes sp.]|nr:PHP domain-containing protein [Alistipes sp.]
MKKSIFLLFALFVALSAVAQEYHAHYQSATEPQTLLPIGYARGYRHEIILPNVNGYTAYKADLHIHTTYSDGSVNVKERVNEAWRDGLDIYAATDHMSIRPVDGKEGQTTPSDVKAKRGAKVTKAVEGALKLADDYGLLVIPGVELTGNALT